MMQEKSKRLEKESSLFSRLLPLLFFPTASLYLEVLVAVFDPKNDLTFSSFFFFLLFSTAAGLAFALLANSLPLKAGRITAIAVNALFTVLAVVQYCCKGFFTTYFPLAFMLQMSSNVAGDFGGDAVNIVISRIPFLLLALVPLVLLIGFRKIILPGGKMSKMKVLLVAAAIVVCQTTGCLMGNFGKDKAIYTYNFTADDAVPKFGLITELRLEGEYALFGMPSPPAPVITDEPEVEAPVSPDPSQPKKVEYGYNVQEIDFSAVAENSTLADMAAYFSSLSPTRQNAHTGQFQGKNLILITAEAFSGYVISPELTPTLYRLAHEGYDFTHYYQPAWGQSTTGGEYSILTGLIPTWQRGGTTTAFYAGKNNLYPYTMGNQLRALGYTTVAYHDGSYDYYNRHLTHPGMGYNTYLGLGNGLNLNSVSDGKWPAEDSEMFDITADSYIDDYVQNGTPFHAYYMTISGHAYYGWSHIIAKKHQETAQNAYPEASSVVQSYVATQLELESALKVLVDKLESAGIADDTVICLSADHYPYAMTTDGPDPYYSELSGTEDTDRDTTRYKNTLILWCGDMEPQQIDAPCTAIDILPTLLNLYGIPYDSRLLSGRDIFAENYADNDKVSTTMPLAVIPTSSSRGWQTLAGTYEPRTDTFIPNPGHQVDDDYVKTVNAMIDAKYSYASKIVEWDYYRLLADQIEPAS